MGEINLLYNVFVPVACMIGIALAGVAAGFSVRNVLKKKYRLFSWIYIALSAVIAFVLAQMLYNALHGFVCTRGTALTILIYAGIDAAMAFVMADAVFSGKKKSA